MDGCFILLGMSKCSRQDKGLMKISHELTSGIFIRWLMSRLSYHPKYPPLWSYEIEVFEQTV